jgi:hypothetical protein
MWDMMITMLLMYTLFDIPFEIGFLDIRYSVYLRSVYLLY